MEEKEEGLQEAGREPTEAGTKVREERKSCRKCHWKIMTVLRDLCVLPFKLRLVSVFLRKFLADDAGAAAGDLLLDFLAGGHGGVAGSGRGERTVAAPYSTAFCRRLKFHETELEAGGEGVAAADAVEDLKAGVLAGFVELAVVPEDGRPSFFVAEWTCEAWWRRP